jgi:hypothetical protein
MTGGFHARVFLGSEDVKWDIAEIAALCRELLALGISEGLPNQPHQAISCFLSFLSSKTPRPSHRMSAGAPKTCPSRLVKVTLTPVK